VREIINALKGLRGPALTLDRNRERNFIRQFRDRDLVELKTVFLDIGMGDQDADNLIHYLNLLKSAKEGTPGLSLDSLTIQNLFKTISLYNDLRPKYFLDFTTIVRRYEKKLIEALGSSADAAMVEVFARIDELIAILESDEARDYNDIASRRAAQEFDAVMYWDNYVHAVPEALRVAKRGIEDLIRGKDTISHKETYVIDKKIQRILHHQEIHGDEAWTFDGTFIFHFENTLDLKAPRKALEKVSDIFGALDNLQVVVRKDLAQLVVEDISQFNEIGINIAEMYAEKRGITEFPDYTKEIVLRTGRDLLALDYSNFPQAREYFDIKGDSEVAGLISDVARYFKDGKVMGRIIADDVKELNTTPEEALAIIKLAVLNKRATDLIMFHLREQQEGINIEKKLDRLKRFDQGKIPSVAEAMEALRKTDAAQVIDIGLARALPHVHPNVLEVFSVS